jgi:hypothetical protein
VVPYVATDHGGSRAWRDIVATNEALSMVLVTKWPEPHQHQESKGTSAASSGSLDPGPIEGMGA